MVPEKQTGLDHLCAERDKFMLEVHKDIHIKRKTGINEREREREQIYKQGPIFCIFY